MVSDTLHRAAIAWNLFVSRPHEDVEKCCLPQPRSLSQLTVGEQAAAAAVEGGAGGGRASAAVLQDAEKRGGAKSGAAAASQKLDLKPPKGTRDVFPEDMRLRNW